MLLWSLICEDATHIKNGTFIIKVISSPLQADQIVHQNGLVRSSIYLTILIILSVTLTVKLCIKPSYVCFKVLLYGTVQEVIIKCGS